ncbi:polysaccharide deacetylase family protein [Terrabacter terrigena]|uniref:Polysaccharide deacetylase family protein n=1 Tax=Terrabacter terrigena TaxID=574718 RepID=A0ABW3MR89_9MICO
MTTDAGGGSSPTADRADARTPGDPRVLPAATTEETAAETAAARATHAEGGARVDRRLFLTAVTGSVALGAAACSAPGGPSASPQSRSASASVTADRTTTSPAPRGPTTTNATTAGGAATTSGRVTPVVLRTDGPDIVHGPTNRALVALTFHGAGDPSLTHRALDLLALHDARVTVFAVGTWLTAHLDLGKALVDGGHDLGNHTWSHRTMPRLDPVDARAEVTRGAEAVARVPGSSPLLFRPSGTPSSTATIRAAARSAGYHRCVSYSVDPRDYADPGPAAVTARTLAGVAPGSIVSLHLGHAGTVAALPSVLSGLASRGLRAVTLSELLA